MTHSRLGKQTKPCRRALVPKGLLWPGAARGVPVEAAFWSVWTQQAQLRKQEPLVKSVPWTFQACFGDR